MRDRYNVTINNKLYYIPLRMMEGIEEYINKGRPTGDFLKAVFSNDFMGCTGRADSENLANLPAYASYLYNVAPIGSYGSLKAYKAWIKKGGLAGT